MRRAIVLPFLTALLFSLVPIVSAPSPLTETVVRFDPAIVELGPDYCVGENFTLTAKIDNVEDLYGFEFKIVWNTTYLEYVEHVLNFPVEIYPDGVLHEPIMVVINEVNAPEGWYYLAVSSLSPAPSFNGSGTAFEITFRVKHQPVDPESGVYFQIQFIVSYLCPTAGNIHHLVEHSNITIYPYWNPADVNDDLKVDIYDLVLCANAYQATPSDPHWNPRCDIVNPYGIIDIFDIVMICASYGEEYTP